MSDKYILTDDRVPVPCDDLTAWAAWFEKVDRRIAKDVVGDVTISTVFLGLDHNWWGKGPPLLYETMIFGGSFDQERDRYPTEELAKEGHARLVRKVRESLC